MPIFFFNHQQISTAPVVSSRLRCISRISGCQNDTQQTGTESDGCCMDSVDLQRTMSKMPKNNLDFKPKRKKGKQTKKNRKLKKNTNESAESHFSTPCGDMWFQRSAPVYRLVFSFCCMGNFFRRSDSEKMKLWSHQN